jgi:TatD DNase family protein
MNPSMELIDTHTHIYSREFREDIGEVIERAISGGVGRFYMPAVDSSSTEAMLALEEAYPGICFSMMGLHPCHVNRDFRSELAHVEGWLEKRKFAAVGEVGLDFHWDTTYVQEQFEAFHLQATWARNYGLPLVIHSRKSMEECIGLVSEHQDGNLRGIFHCFSGSEEQARRITDLGFLLGIGGVATYKNGGLEPVIRAIGLSQVVLETDAPYLAPVPFRGKRNEPSYLTRVAEKLAEFTGTEVSEVARITTENALKLFA